MAGGAAPGAAAGGGLLRVLACGSVDDGKSTLIGRLLFDAGAVPEDHLRTLAADSARVGTRGAELDYALLLDGLAAEREQGITIDVAWRQFATPRRRFVIADAPGHEQYTRNMATGAAAADVAVLLVDARKGLLTQTLRHSRIAALFGVREVVLAVNKMDLVDLSQAVFERIAADYRAFASQLGLARITAIPMVAADGDNVVARSTRMPWYAGPTLLERLETADPADAAAEGGFCLPVQWVNRPDADFRGYAGRVVRGRIRPGDALRVLPGGRETRVARIVTMDGDAEEAVAGQSTTLVTATEVDVARGDVLVAAAAPLEVADQFEATLLWLDDEPLLPGRQYDLKLGTQLARASVNPLKHRIDVDSGGRLAAERLELNDLGVGEIALDRPVVFAPHAEQRELGRFILVDRQTRRTAAVGLLHFALRRARNIHWQAHGVDRALRARQKQQQPCVVWFTGLSGAGKSVIANLVEQRLVETGRHTYLLDGDNVRHGLNRDLGFTPQDRVENVRRVTEVATLMADAGLIVLVAMISPFRAERAQARERVTAAGTAFIEVFVDTPLEVAEARDVKGLYARARRGELRNFTGVDSPYEPPASPEVRIDGSGGRPQDAAERVVAAVLALRATDGGGAPA
ncbi:MAG: adenylyl-sulfate kinase [Gammaproteobacteria bacterium]|nr:adenylyl-sulfate kinase [Gammaproteobacteria bacterium]